MAVDADGNPVADDDDIRQLYPGQKENRETLPYRDLKKKACVHCSFIYLLFTFFCISIFIFILFIYFNFYDIYLFLFYFAF